MDTIRAAVEIRMGLQDVAKAIESLAEAVRTQAHVSSVDAREMAQGMYESCSLLADAIDRASGHDESGA